MKNKIIFIILINIIVSGAMYSITSHTSITNLNKTLISFNAMDRFKFFSSDNDDSQEEKFYKSDRLFRILHASFMGIAYTGFIALDAVGITKTALFFNNSPYKDDTSLLFANLGIGIPTVLSFATAISFAFTKFALKKKQGYKIRKAHFVVAFISLGFYLADLGMIIASSIFNANNYANREWINLSYNIVNSLFIASLSVSIITIFL